MTGLSDLRLILLNYAAMQSIAKKFFVLPVPNKKHIRIKT